jgi:hypothetical protein
VSKGVNRRAFLALGLDSDHIDSLLGPHIPGRQRIRKPEAPKLFIPLLRVPLLDSVTRLLNKSLASATAYSRADFDWAKQGSNL